MILDLKGSNVLKKTREKRKHSIIFIGISMVVVTGLLSFAYMNYSKAKDVGNENQDLSVTISKIEKENPIAFITNIYRYMQNKQFKELGSFD